jgi:hypothetical protein
VVICQNLKYLNDVINVSEIISQISIEVVILNRITKKRITTIIHNTVTIYAGGLMAKEKNKVISSLKENIIIKKKLKLSEPETLGHNNVQDPVLMLQHGHSSLHNF